MVYLICFSDKLSDHAQHYVGHCKDNRLATRMAEHRTGSGAKILQVASQQGIDWDMVRGWPGGDESLERRIKMNGHIKKLCPSCNPDSWENYGQYHTKKVSDEKINKKWFSLKSWKKWKEGR